MIYYLVLQYSTFQFCFLFVWLYTHLKVVLHINIPQNGIFFLMPFIDTELLNFQYASTLKWEILWESSTQMSLICGVFCVCVCVLFVCLIDWLICCCVCVCSIEYLTCPFDLQYSERCIHFKYTKTQGLHFQVC